MNLRVGMTLETPIGTRFQVKKIAKDIVTVVLCATGEEATRDLKNGELAGWQEVKDHSSSQASPSALPAPHPTPREDTTLRPATRDLWECAHRDLLLAGHPDPISAACERVAVPLLLGESWCADSLFAALVWRYAMSEETDARKGKLAWSEVQERLGVQWSAEEAREKTVRAMERMPDAVRALWRCLWDRRERKKHAPLLVQEGKKDGKAVTRQGRTL